ncbi:isocitrate lyase/PEP mutase family protein [Actinokineospora sp.]|uniref:isocitrate lyase/PEP mutase family protein n=1 Tax=Actinokineospora sp. TaxID=1872133 RepID=UPI003D6A8586
MTFADLHHGPRPLTLPNAWDVASGLLLADAGFAAIGTTSLGVTAAAGLPDGTGTSPDLTMGLARALVGRLAVPLTVDLEGGYSDDPGAVAALAAELADLGVAGINLEDATRPVEVHAAIIRAVAEAAPALFINARTDTYWLDDGHRDETIPRLFAYRDAGASGVFVPGLSEPGEIAAVAEQVGLPLNVLWQAGIETTPGIARISTGSAIYRHALGAALAVADCARTGETPATTAVSYPQLQRRLGI